MLTPKFLEISERSKKLRDVRETSSWNCCSVNGYVYITLLFSLLGGFAETVMCVRELRDVRLEEVVQEMLRLACRRTEISWLVLPHFPVKISLIRVYSLACPWNVSNEYIYIVWHESQKGHFNPFRSYVEPRPTVWFACFAPMSENVRHGFCCVCSPTVGACPTLFLM
jgi:hypothetical protein